MKYRIEKIHPQWWVRTLTPVIAIIITFLITSVIILMAKANPLEAYYYILVEPLTSKTSAIEVLVKATPLLLTGACVLLAFSAGFYNIGGEGQFMAGALAATTVGILMKGVPSIVAIPVMIIVSFIGGALWALIPALLKTKLGAGEAVTTLLFNSIILFIISYFLNGVWRNHTTGWPQSPEISDTAMFFKIIPRSRLHFGFIIAIAAILIIWYVLSRTSFGIKIRAIGFSKDAAKFAGINVNLNLLIVALVSGGLAGLAGGGDIAGIHYHLLDSIGTNLGYNGIVVAMFAGLNPLATIPSALFLGLIGTGAQSVSRALGVPTYLGDVVQATLLLVTLAMFVIQNYRIKRV